MYTCNAQNELAGSIILRERISINDDWRFFKYSMGESDNLIYDVRPEIEEFQDDKDAGTKPTEAEEVEAIQMVLKP